MLRNERGAAAVEFALVSTVLVVLLLAIIEFAFMFFTWSTLAGAAREGVRDYAIGKDAAHATTVATSAAVGLGVTSSQVTVTPVCPTTPAPTPTEATVIINYPYSGFTGAIPNPPTLTAKGVMRCGG